MASQVTEDSCVVCFRDIYYCSVGTCEHSVCFECSARMRVLLGQNECPICRQELEHVVFTTGPRNYKDVQDKLRRFIFAPRYKIYMEDMDIQKQFDKLLESRCLLCPDITFKDFSGLQTHVQRNHDLFACDLCIEHVKLFPIERRFYSRSDLAYHRRKGDKDDRSFRGHPLCQFCDRRYFDEDDLFKHLRKDHYFCHFCDADGLNHFYNTYDDLRVHFRCEHFLCEEENCKDEKFTSVFRTEIDLKAHLASSHSRLLGKHGLKQARHLDVEFNMPRRPDEGGRLRRNFRERSEREQRERAGHPNKERENPPEVVEDSLGNPTGNREVVQVPSQKKAQINLESAMDFPTLGKRENGAAGPGNGVGRPPSIATAVAGPTPVPGSGAPPAPPSSRGPLISQRVALSNGMNVSKSKRDDSSRPNWNAKVSGSSKMDEEFPALKISGGRGGSSSSSFGNNNANQAGIKSFISATNSKPQPQKPVATDTRQAVPKSEDFPELGQSSKGASSSRGNAWTGPGVKMKQGRGDYQGKKVAAAPVLPGRSLQSTDLSSSNGYFSSEDFRFVPLNLNNDRSKPKGNNFDGYQRKKP